MHTSLFLALLLSLAVEQDSTSVTLRGRVHVEQAAGKPASEAIATFRATDGKQLRLKRTITSEGLFTDPHVRTLDLEVSGRAEGSALDVIQVRSIHDGKLHDLFYWCETCRIRSSAPGPCWCCFQPFEFREEPIPTPPSPK